MDRALGQRDLDEARRAWESAHLAAVESFELGRTDRDGTGLSADRRRHGGSDGRRAGSPASATSPPCTARARQNSFEGILRAAEAFDDLGDRDVVEECLGLVELQADGEQTRREVMALVGRLGVRRASANGDGAAAGAAGAA